MNFKLISVSILVLAAIVGCNKSEGGGGAPAVTVTDSFQGEFSADETQAESQMAFRFQDSPCKSKLDPRIVSGFTYTGVMKHDGMGEMSGVGSYIVSVQGVSNNTFLKHISATIAGNNVEDSTSCTVVDGNISCQGGSLQKGQTTSLKGEDYTDYKVQSGIYKFKNGKAIKAYRTTAKYNGKLYIDDKLVNEGPASVDSISTLDIPALDGENCGQFNIFLYQAIVDSKNGARNAISMEITDVRP